MSFLRNKRLKYYKIYKPYGVLSQFTDKSDRPTLKTLYKFPQDVYPVGRLDLDSEGLLILTNDKKLNELLLSPLSGTGKEYLVLVEGEPSEADLNILRSGVIIEGKRTLPALAEKINTPELPPRDPPVRVRKNIQDTWLKIIINEGRNRQIRKMTAKIGFPTLRLIRTRIRNISLEGLKPGETAELSEKEYAGLFIH
jgi:23S rRNA pseudouridine2457 synthase